MALVRTLASSFVDICCRGTPSISTLYNAETWLSSSARSYMSAIARRQRTRERRCARLRWKPLTRTTTHSVLFDVTTTSRSIYGTR